jgi:hypothetical protein
MSHLPRVLHTALLALVWPAQALAAPTAVDASAPSGTLSASARSSSSGEARDEGPPLLFDKKVPVGAYAGLDVAYSRMFGQDGAVVGVQGALVLDHRLSLGLAGYGWTNSQPAPDDATGGSQSFETGYGGATIRYSIFLPGAPVYLTLGTLIGGGAIVLGPEDHDDFDYDDADTSEDVFALVQPDVTLHANLTHWMRFGLTAGYRLTTGVDRMGFEESDINGLVLGGQLQFGRF